MRYSKAYWGDLERTLAANDQEPLRGKSVLVTGATGLIGTAVLDLLIWLNEREGYGMRLLAASRSAEAVRERFAPYSGRDYFGATAYDALEPVRIGEGADYVVCAAGNSHPESIGREPVETMLANLRGAYNLLEYARERQCGRFLFVSSSEAYGRKGDDRPYGEGDYGYVDLLNPRACYPSAKRAAETLCAAYRAEYGIDFVIVRPGHVYGPTQTDGDSRASAQFLRAAARGEAVVLKSAGMQMRSYCHCLDCASAILAVLARGEAGEAYNISNPDSVVRIADFARACASAAGVALRGGEPTEEERARYNMMENSALDSAKLARLGWKGVWDAESGIMESIRILRELRECER